MSSIIITEHQVMMMKKYGLIDDEIYLISQRIQSTYDFIRIIKTICSIKKDNNTLINLLIVGKNMNSMHHNIYHYIFENNDTSDVFVHKESGNAVAYTSYI
jgi:hypothetical protein